MARNEGTKTEREIRIKKRDKQLLLNYKSISLTITERKIFIAIIINRQKQLSEDSHFQENYKNWLRRYWSTGIISLY